MSHDLAASIAQLQGEIGRPLDIVQEFYDWTDPFPDGNPADGTYGTIPYQTYQTPGATYMVTWGNYTGKLTNHDITDGSEDANIRAHAEALKDFGHPVFLRFDSEMNGWWYPWGGTKNGAAGIGPASYVAMWRHVHDIFAEVGATNVTWVWVVSANSNPDVAWNNIQAYYPGNAYVDWVGADEYDFSRSTGFGCPCSVKNIFGPSYEAMQQFAPGKPYMIAETGNGPGAKYTDQQYYSQLAAWAAAHPNLKALVWFDTDDNGQFRTDLTASGEQAFKALVNQPPFTVALRLPGTGP
ncbi:MAG: glycoside hydrolase family 26 protein [Acidimicrobiales bacterium]